MLTTHTHEDLHGSHSISAPWQNDPVEAGRQCHGRLWSSLKEICDLLHVPSVHLSGDEEMLFQHVQFKTGQRIHTIGQAFDALYLVHSGFLKTVLIDESGGEQVLHFPMKGDLLGVDGIHARHYASEAVALSECNLILLPFKKLIALGKTHPELENTIYDVLSQELVREQGMAGMLSAMGAEARVARFLLTMADRFERMGYSGKLFNLRMTRHEIGSYLGLTLETVSRTLSVFNELGWISVHQRSIEIKDLAALENLRKIPSSRARPRKVVQVSL